MLELYPWIGTAIGTWLSSRRALFGAFFKGQFDLGSVVEGNNAICQDLVVLMPFSGNHHYVLIARAAHRQSNRRRTVGLDFDLIHPPDACKDVGDDLLRIFTAWIIGSHQYFVGMGLGYLTHLWTLGRIAIAAASEVGN